LKLKSPVDRRAFSPITPKLCEFWGMRSSACLFNAIFDDYQATGKSEMAFKHDKAMLQRFMVPSLMRCAPLSTEQVQAFVELARLGSLRLAAQNLHLSDEGLRSRILVLEQTLNVALYEKARGRRGDVMLTPAGRRFLQRAGLFLDQARALTGLFDTPADVQSVQIFASHYLLQTLVAPMVKALQSLHPKVQVRLSTRAEIEIPKQLINESNLAIGICTPSEFSNELHYQKLRCTTWCAAVPNSHPLARRKNVSLTDLANEPLITFERGSSGRLHVFESFYAHGLEPKVSIEAPSSALLLGMVSEGLGIAIVTETAFSDLANTAKVTKVALIESVRAIETGLYVRQEFRADPFFQHFIALAMEQPQLRTS
jgi:DNA-binding transcriptional LysR family regulator